ncbi:MAG: phosphate ABC transporter substrate-binding protein PstS [Geitlerinemataceae cyanobacterium]
MPFIRVRTYNDMAFFMISLRRMATASVATVALSLSPLSAAIAATLNGAGATFPAPLYERYFNDFQQETENQVNYEAIGSGGGIRQFIAGTVDFGGTDAPPKTDEISQMKDGLILVPTAGGAVAVVFNLPISDLKLSREVLPAIFEGEITRWNDAKIAADNPGVTLPNKPIRVVVRSDGSGTSYIFTSHLEALDSEIAANKEPDWPGNTLGGRGNEGVAAEVQRTEGAIGYVQADYASENNMKTAMLENQAGDFVNPTIANANTAMDGLRFNDDFTVANISDPDAGYPIVGITWLMIKTDYGDAEKADSIKKLVEWILTKGQNINNDLQYTKIPQATADRAISQVKSEVK